MLTCPPTPQCQCPYPETTTTQPRNHGECRISTNVECRAYRMEVLTCGDVALIVSVSVVEPSQRKPHLLPEGTSTSRDRPTAAASAGKVLESEETREETNQTRGGDSWWHLRREGMSSSSTFPLSLPSLLLPLPPPSSLPPLLPCPLSPSSSLSPRPYVVCQRVALGHREHIDCSRCSRSTALRDVGRSYRVVNPS